MLILVPVWKKDIAEMVVGWTHVFIFVFIPGGCAPLQNKMQKQANVFSARPASQGFCLQWHQIELYTCYMFGQPCWEGCQNTRQVVYANPHHFPKTQPQDPQEGGEWWVKKEKAKSKTPPKSFWLPGVFFFLAASHLGTQCHVGRAHAIRLKLEHEVVCK